MYGCVPGNFGVEQTKYAFCGNMETLTYAAIPIYQLQVPITEMCHQPWYTYLYLCSFLILVQVCVRVRDRQQIDFKNISRSIHTVRAWLSALRIISYLAILGEHNID